jgi:hypothetical protein
MENLNPKKWDVISPDGISIHHEDTYDSPEKAIEAFYEWKKRYEHQGYYSSAKGRICLDDLQSECSLVELNY